MADRGAAEDIVTAEPAAADFIPSALLDLTRVTEYENMNIRKTAEHTRAFLKVQDGCNQFCS